MVSAIRQGIASNVQRRNGLAETRIQAHSSNRAMHTEVTKVPVRRSIAALTLAAALGFAAGSAAGESQTASEPQPGPAARLYQQLGTAGLDPARVYHVRDASMERPGVQFTLEDGTIAFTQDVMGAITGAFFEGEGEVLISPPNEVERQSMGLFTGGAILEERFASAYFRFNDNTAGELAPGLRAAEDPAEFCGRWRDAAVGLAGSDALRLLQTFSRALPTANKDAQGAGDPRPGPRAHRAFPARHHLDPARRRHHPDMAETASAEAPARVRKRRRFMACFRLPLEGVVLSDG
jgi:hypothetical protein